MAGRARTRIGSSLSITANRACATRAGQARDRARNTGKFGLRTDHDGAVKVQDKQGIGESVLVAQLAPFSFLKLRTRFRVARSDHRPMAALTVSWLDARDGDFGGEFEIRPPDP